MSPSELHPYNIVIVCPTWACNFRCWYCYQDHADEWMSDKTVSAVMRFLSKNSLRCNWLWLEFFGGEPLLSHDTILLIAANARASCRDHAIPFSCGISTNGYLLDPMPFSQLCDVGVNHLQITLDGAPDFHDRQRTLASGRGTWDRIWANLLHIRASSAPVKVVLRLHFQVAELDQAIRLVEDQINPTFAGDERFSVQFEEIKPLGGPNDSRIECASPEDSHRIRHQLASLLRRPAMLAGLTSSNYDCYASRSNTVVVTPEGGLAKCTVSLDRIGRLTADGRIARDAASYTRWVQQAAACPNCPRHGSPQTQAATGRYSLPVLNDLS